MLLCRTKLDAFALKPTSAAFECFGFRRFRVEGLGLRVGGKAQHPNIAITAGIVCVCVCVCVWDSQLAV